MTAFHETLSHALRLTFFITIPSMAGLMILGRPIIQLFFQRGAFDLFSTLMTDRALFFYAAGLWAFSGTRVMVNAFYAIQDTRTPVKVATVAMFANFLFGLLLMGPLQHGGLALALSLASALQFWILLLALKRAMGMFRARPILISAGKSVAASIVMGAVLYFLQATWLVTPPDAGTGRAGRDLFLLILIGSTVYFVTAWALRCPEISSVREVLRSRSRRR
jgi:putative peptidoglycan lipid II flippase